MYIDVLTRIKNAQNAGHEKLKVPYSKMDMAVLDILASNKFVHAVEKKGRMPKRVIEIRIKYKKDKTGPIQGVKFVSTPGRKVYAGCRDLKPVRNGFGISVLTTPKGIMSGKDAKKAGVGGQVLFEIW